MDLETESVTGPVEEALHAPPHATRVEAARLEQVEDGAVDFIRADARANAAKPEPLRVASSPSGVP
jgi:hypothetical protein